MKKLKIILIFALIFVGIWLVNKVFNSWYFNHYKYLDQNPHTENSDFVIKRVSRHSIDFHFNDPATKPMVDGNGAIVMDTLPPKDKYVGWIYLDTLKLQYYFREIYYKHFPKQPDEDDALPQEMHRWITLNKEGTVMDSMASDSLVPPLSAILLEDVKGNFPDWSDKKSLAYINHFAREEFNWNIFNPFSAMGSPNGGTPAAYWYGHAYYTINHANQKIKFKEAGASYGDGDYGHNIRFSVTPKRFKDLPLLTFIISDKNFERSGLYVVVKK